MFPDSEDARRVSGLSLRVRAGSDFRALGFFGVGEELRASAGFVENNAVITLAE